MTKHILPIVVLLSLSILPCAQAEPVKIWGSGADSCKAWQESRAKGGDAELKQWLFGFVSAHNYYTAQQQVQLPQGDIGAAYAHVAQYCERHPSHHVTAAAAAYVKSLGGLADSPRSKI